MSEVRISTTRFRLGSDEFRGVKINPGLWVLDEGGDGEDFLVPEEVNKLRDWLNENYPAEATNANEN